MPPWKTRYCTLQFAPGGEAFQLRVTLLVVWLGEASPAGTLGSVLQAADSVLTERAALCAELPNSFTAATV